MSRLLSAAARAGRGVTSPGRRLGEAAPGRRVDCRAQFVEGSMVAPAAGASATDAPVIRESTTQRWRGLSGLERDVDATTGLMRANRSPSSDQSSLRDLRSEFARKQPIGRDSASADGRRPAKSRSTSSALRHCAELGEVAAARHGRCAALVRPEASWRGSSWRRAALAEALAARHHRHASRVAVGNWPIIELARSLPLARSSRPACRA